jgi:SAM-dependent methyltransferase
MKISSAVSQDEGAYLAREYALIDFHSVPLQRFMDEIHAALLAQGISQGHSILDVGCGRGYLLRYLAEKGFSSLRGLDPCQELVRNRLSETVGPGAFFEPGVADKSFDVVITCHTLHHLRKQNPIQEIAWMGHTARRLVVIVEINNTNMPMLLMSLFHRKVEANAFRYNLRKTMDLCRHAGLGILHASHMKSGYISGDSSLHCVAAAAGTKPYNIVLAKP